eukprot:9477431-Pyramimonas_sp.AAC.1
MGISVAGRHREVLRQPPHRRSDSSSLAAQLPSEAALPHDAAALVDENIEKSRSVFVAPYIRTVQCWQGRGTPTT